MIRLPAERCPACGAITYIPLGGAPDPVEAAEKLTTHAATCHNSPAAR